MKVLQVEDIEKSKKRKKILKGLSFSVGEREIVGLLGPNGSGKSTTIKCISGLYRTDRGRIRICGNDIKSNRLEALKQIGIAMEVPALYPELSGIQNLRMAATARKVPKERVEELAVFTDLGDETFGSHRNLFHGNENATESGNSDCGSTQTGNSGRADQWP
ncbi:MAG: ATP-binding cassette domain-containing protein [Roseburia hominis]